VITNSHMWLKKRLTCFCFLIHYFNSLVIHIFVTNTQMFANVISLGSNVFLQYYR
jgi:hypothetical protein